MFHVCENARKFVNQPSPLQLVPKPSRLPQESESWLWNKLPKDIQHEQDQHKQDQHKQD